MATTHFNNNTLLRTVLVNNKFIEAFPFLKAAKDAMPPSNCSSCEQKAYLEKWAPIAEQAKSLIAVLAPDRAAEFKRLLGLAPGDSLKIFYLDSNNRTQSKLL